MRPPENTTGAVSNLSKLWFKRRFASQLAKNDEQWLVTTAAKNPSPPVSHIIDVGDLDLAIFAKPGTYANAVQHVLDLPGWNREGLSQSSKFKKTKHQINPTHCATQSLQACMPGFSHTSTSSAKMSQYLIAVARRPNNWSQFKWALGTQRNILSLHRGSKQRERRFATIINIKRSAQVT